MRRRTIVVTLATAAIAATALAPALASTPAADPTVPAGREVEPVVLTGSSFPQWAAPAEVTAKAPSVAGANCTGGGNTCTHNTYEQPEVATGDKLGSGVDVHKLLGYRWTGHKFVQIPFQVDEMATRYLSNNASTFSFYSETDQHPTYVFDQERFRWTKSDPANPCHAVADGAPSTPDPVPGLDTNDELSFMASDAGPDAPSGAEMPKGIVGASRVEVRDPQAPGKVSYVYVMLAGTDKHAPKPAYDANNGYVRYLPDTDSDTFLYSQSSYGSYGNAAKGPYFDPTANPPTCVTDPAKWKQRRPKDTAWVKTPRYQFRYDGRWLMTGVHVVPPGVTNALTHDPSTWQYGLDLVDEWKARAFQQRPGGTTPCCGYEEEVNNWGGSSILMGVRAGPVRAIRATWGADSSTNNIRTEYFYRDEFRTDDYLRVHVIPPADGIYSQWDFNASKVSKYYNAYVPNGVDADGRNDEVFGNDYLHVAGDGLRLQDGDQVPVVGPFDVGTPGSTAGSGCHGLPKCIDNDSDVADPTFSGPIGTLSYEEVTGDNGTWVDRTTVKQVTGGAAYGLVTAPYYRDDSCFDDGTGKDPGPHVNGRDTDPTVDSNGQGRACWLPANDDPSDPTAQPAGQAPDHFYQGDIATHGVHIELIADSDNAFTTVPLDEVDAEQTVVLLPGEKGNVGEQYGRGPEKPLVATAVPMAVGGPQP